MLNDLVILIFLIFIKLYIINSENKLIFLIYIFINFVINSLLKVIINEPRPINHNTNYSFLQRNGMPSGHAQISFFIYFFYKDNIKNKNININRIILILACLTSFERIYNNKHTLEQVLVGIIIGSLLGMNLKNKVINF